MLLKSLALSPASDVKSISNRFVLVLVLHSRYSSPAGEARLVYPQGRAFKSLIRRGSALSRQCRTSQTGCSPRIGTAAILVVIPPRRSLSVCRRSGGRFRRHALRCPGAPCHATHTEPLDPPRIAN